MNGKATGRDVRLGASVFLLLFAFSAGAWAADLPTISGHPIRPETYKAYVEEGFLPLRREMSDFELAEKLNLDLPQLAAVKAAVEKKDSKALEKALAAYLNAKLPPRRYRETGKPAAEHIRKHADVWLGDEIEWAGKRWKLGERANWWQSVGPGGQADGGIGFSSFGRWLHPLENAYMATGDPKYARAILAFLRSFYHNARPPAKRPKGWGHKTFRGPWHSLWASGRIMPGYLPSACRIIGVSPLVTDSDRTMILKMFWEHADYCYGLTEVRKAHNFEVHVINGLMNVPLTFPEFRDSSQWLKRVCERFADNMNDTILDDGGAFERTGYHFAYLGPYAANYRRLKNAGTVLPDAFRNKLETMFEWTMWVLAPTLEYPLFGHGGLGPMTGVMATGASIFPEREDFAYVVSSGRKGRPSQRVARVLPHTGWLTMRGDWSRNALYMAVNYNGSPAGTDGHDDLLSFGLWAYGIPWMTNCGSTTHYGDPAYYSWCTPTVSKNTVMVDNVSQRRHDTAGRLESWSSLPAAGPGFTYLAASSDAYPRTGRGVVHRRAVLFIRPAYWLIYDRLVGDGKPHDLTWLGHFQPTALTIDPNTKAVSTEPKHGRRLWLIPAEPSSFALEQNSGPIVSRQGKDVRGPYVSLVKRQIRTPTFFAVLLYPVEDDKEPPSLERLAVKEGHLKIRGAEAVGFRIVCGDYDDLVAMTTASRAERMMRRQYGDGRNKLITDAEMAYVRRKNGSVTEMGLSGGRFLRCGNHLVVADPDVSAVYYSVYNAKTIIRSTGRGEIGTSSPAAKSVADQEVQTSALKALLRKSRVGHPGPLTLSAPVFSTDPLELCRTIGLPSERVEGVRLRNSKDSAVVAWDTSAPADATVRYRAASGESWVRTVNPEPTTRHRFVLTNLRHDTAYEIHLTSVTEDGRIGRRKASYKFVEPAIAAARATVNKGLLAWYTFDTGQGRTVVDASGNKNDGRLNGGAKYVKAGRGQALDLNGLDAYVDCGAKPGLDTGPVGAVAVWCRAELPQGGIVSRSSGSGWNDQRMVLALRSDKQIIGVLADGKSELVSAFGTMAPRAWTHVAMTWDGKRMTLYRDGKIVAGKPQTLTPMVSGLPLRIGWSQGLGNQFLKGMIDDVRIYDRALSPKEVQVIHGMTKME